MSSSPNNIVLTRCHSAARSVSATARSTIDSCRVIGIWAVSLFLGWETFKPLQVVGCVTSSVLPLVWPPSGPLRTVLPSQTSELTPPPLPEHSFALLSYGAFTYNGITSFPHWTGLHRDALPAGSPPASPPFGAALGGHGPEDADVAPIGTGEQAPLLPRRE